MSNDEKIMAKLEALERSVIILSVAILGDEANGKPGMADVVETQRREIYGDEPTQHIGLKKLYHENEERLRSLEDDRKKIYWLSAGIAAAISGAWTAAKAWFTHKP